MTTRLALAMGAAALVWGLHPWAEVPPARAQASVALELVLAVDTSTSVDEREFALQQFRCLSVM